MDKTPMKKIRMMDIVRKKPAAATPTSWKPKEDQVKFTIERKPELHQKEIISIPKEDIRKSVIVETTPLRAISPQQEAREEILKEMKTTAMQERAALNMRAEQQKVMERQVLAEKVEEKHEAPRILETHAPEPHPTASVEPRPESLPPVAYRQTTGESIKLLVGERRTQGMQPIVEKLVVMPEVSPMEINRPLAYIPKEKTTREEKKVLERIEKRERSQKKEVVLGKRRGVIMWGIVCMLLGLGAYFAVAVLPRSEVVLVPKTVKWDYANVIGASTKIADIDIVNRQIPVAVFSEKKTNAFRFPATGSGKSIERKSSGKVVIYNEYSGNSQPLVGGTRLETPDGKIFRLKDRVVVPGAKTEGSELVPSSIEADVIADKAGESYNIGAVNKFTIPGFKGTEKYEKFYGESKGLMAGGFIGEGKYPTAEDIKKAKESSERKMKEVVESFLAAQVVPEGFKTIESSRRFTNIKEVVNESVDDQGTFSIYMESEGGVDAIKEESVLKLMTALARQVNGDDWKVREHTISYGDMTVDSKTGAIALPVDFKGVFWKPIDMDDFKRNMLNKKEDELKAYIFSSTSIEKADVSLWPFWVKRVPNDVDRVKVELK